MDTPPRKRPAMFASVIRQVVAPILRECPPECGMVSITEVEVSEDYSVATISISALKEVALALTFLKGELPRLKHMVATSLSLRRVPLLRLRIDHRSEQGDRIDRLLQG